MRSSIDSDAWEDEVMITLTEFRTPEETALQLELLLLGTLTDADVAAGPVAVAPVSDERRTRALRRVAERLEELADGGEETVGVLGAVTPARRAQVSAALAALIATRRPVTLLDVDLRAGLLSFDNRAYAQEGVVDVVRYGVRSPRVVAPTQVPGLSLLPVGSGTVDLAGTWSADSFEPLLRELSRSGDLLLVNGPGAEDVEDAQPLLERVSHWILLHEIGAGDSEATRHLRDFIGGDRILGVFVLHPGHGAKPAVASESAAVHATEEESWETPVGNEDLRTTPLPRRRAEDGDDDTAAPSEPRKSRAGFVIAGVAVLAAAAVLVLPKLVSPPVDVGPPPIISFPPTEDAVPREAPPSQSLESPPIDSTPVVTTPPLDSAPPATTPPVTSSPPAKAPPPVVSSPRVAAVASGPFAVHISSMHTGSKADEDASRLRVAGVETFTRRVDLGAKGIWHRVYAGPFADRASAEAASADILARKLSDYAMVQRVSGEASRAR